VTHSKMDPRVTGMLPEAAAEDFSGLVWKEKAQVPFAPYWSMPCNPHLS
jgi:hypothetical protein